MRSQGYVAGVLPNSAANLIKWIQHPRAIDPKTAMPELGVSEVEARNMAAYLYNQ
jgi:cytochrome c1